MKRLFGFYCVFFLVFTLVFLGLFHTPLFAGQKVLFYRGILLLLTVVVLAVGALIILKPKLKGIRLESVIAVLVLSTSLHLVFFVVFPVTFERSVTMFLLNTMASASKETVCKGYSDKELRNRLINTYIRKEDAVGRRMMEQKSTSFVNGTGNCRVLTQNGRDFIELSKIVGRLYGLKTDKR